MQRPDSSLGTLQRTLIALLAIIVLASLTIAANQTRANQPLPAPTGQTIDN